MQQCVPWNIEWDLTAKNCILVDFSHYRYLYVRNADHEFAVLDWNYASVQNTAGHSELKSIDGDFPKFEIDQNEPIDVGSVASFFSMPHHLTWARVASFLFFVRHNLRSGPSVCESGEQSTCAASAPLFPILRSVRHAPFFPVSGALLKSSSVSVSAFLGFGRCRDTSHPYVRSAVCFFFMYSFRHRAFESQRIRIPQVYDLGVTNLSIVNTAITSAVSRISSANPESEYP